MRPEIKGRFLWHKTIGWVMSKSRLINTNFWKDNYIVDLDPSEKLVFNYLFTNPRTNIAGVYEINAREISFDTAVDKNRVDEIIEKFEKDKKITYTNGWIILHNAVRHQMLNPSVIRGIERVYDELTPTLRQTVTSVWVEYGIDILLGDWVQTGDSLSTDTPQRGTPNLTKPNSTKLNLTKPIGTVPIEKSAGGDDGKKQTKVEKTKPGEIDEAIDYWHTTVRTNIRNNDSNRQYASKLLKEHGMDNLKKLIDGASMAADDRYAPTIANFKDLHQRQERLILWGKKKMNTSMSGVAKI